MISVDEVSDPRNQNVCLSPTRSRLNQQIGVNGCIDDHLLLGVKWHKKIQCHSKRSSRNTFAQSGDTPKLDERIISHKLRAMPKTFIDLFAGIGGFHWAQKYLKYKCLLAVEKDEAAQKIYARNFPEKKRKGKHNLNRLVGDIRSITRENPEEESTELTALELKERLKIDYKIIKGDVGVICGGFPCQPFSKSGEQKGDKDATRGTLFHDILLLTEALEPDYLFLENVRNLAGKNHKHTLATIVKRIKGLKYDIEDNPITLSPHKLPGKDGSPQVRDRVFILARRIGGQVGASPKEGTARVLGRANAREGVVVGQAGGDYTADLYVGGESERIIIAPSTSRSTTYLSLYFCCMS